MKPFVLFVGQRRATTRDTAPTRNEWISLMKRVNGSLMQNRDLIESKANDTNQSLQHVVSSSELLALRLSKVEKLLQTIQNEPMKNCQCSGHDNAAAAAAAAPLEPTEQMAPRNG